MKHFSFAVIAMAAALTFTPAARADTLNYTFVGSGLDAALTFTYNSGTGIISNVAGTLTAGVDILTPVTFSGAPVYNPNVGGSNTISSNGVGIQYDNVLYATQTPILDFSGVLFQVNGIDINIYSVPGGYQWLDDVSYTNGSNSADPITATPEPSSLLLLGTGLFGLAFVMFRKATPSGLVLQS